MVYDTFETLFALFFLPINFFFCLLFMSYCHQSPSQRRVIQYGFES